MSAYTEKVSNMGLYELVEEVLDNPEYLTSPFFIEHGAALRDRLKYFVDIHHKMREKNKEVFAKREAKR